MEITFKDQVALVTGGSSGIGEATAVAFAEAGAAVVIADVSDRGAEVAQRLVDGGHRAIFVKTDVSDEAQVKTMIDAAVSEFGSLDVAFNCAAYEGALGPVDAQELPDVQKVIATNLQGIWLCDKYELDQMKKQGKGAIVNCASVGGLVGVAAMPVYSATKHGVIGLTRSAALSTATTGIRINAVCPGYVQTPMADRLTSLAPGVHEGLLSAQPIGRVGEPSEVAAAVLWLASPLASLVTGTALAVDGGWSAQ
ncbi:glucose 1-dehydrogenase [Microbacterium sp. No. 7]|uniref:glucose 1-dehydrogenase n=1 Tax=Microbacterium sp. No. 7 TaxID=1714373 RepID=UPI0006D12B0F|nr:glucose 1-dehydrogenase [Microbacterium sp. No. 7]ALJ20017.1 hypothetical protein AOA12_08885 [Microbacterium sp. No. 7]